MKILLTDESSPEVRLLAAALHETATGIELILASSSAVADTECDAIVLRLCSGDSGEAALLRKDSSVPVIALVPDAGAGEEAIAIGADDYLIQEHAPAAAVLRAVSRAVQAKAREVAPIARPREAQLAELGRFLLAYGDVRSFLDEACRTLVRGLGASHAAFIEFDPQDGTAAIRGAAGSALYLDVAADTARGSELAFVMRGIRPVIVRDYAEEQRFAPASFIGASALRTSVSCPVIIRGATIGVLGVWAGGRESFTDADAVFVEAVANVIADFLAREHGEHAQERVESLRRMAGRLGRIGGWVVDLSSGEITWSDELRAIHGAPHDFVATLENGLELYVEESRGRLVHAFEECVRSGFPFDIEVQVLSSTEPRWLRVTGEPDYDASGQIRCVRGASQDISVFKAAEKQVREQAHRLTTMLESITDGFLLIGFDRTVTYVNSAAEEVLGVARDAALGRDVRYVLGALGDRDFEREAETILGAAEPMRMEAHCAAAGRWISIRAFPSPEGTALYVRDVSDEHRARHALIESERRFRTLAEAIPQIVWMTAATGAHVYANPRWAEFVGNASSDVDWSDYVHPDDRQHALEAWRAACATEQVHENEARLRRHDGAYRWMLVRALPIRDEAGAVTHWLGTSTDIHDLREALEATRASEEERSALVAALEHEKRTLVDIFRQAPNFMAVVRGPDHVFEFANDAYYRCVGQRDIIGKPVAEAFPELVEQQYPALLDRVFSTGVPVSLHSTGIMLRREPESAPEQRYVDFVYHPLTEADGTVTGILAQGADVTERYLAQARAHQQAALIDEASDAIIVRDLELRISFWSKGAERLYGWSAADAIGKNSATLLGMEKETLAEMVATVRDRGEAHLEMRVTDARGSAMTIDRRCTLLCDEEGRPAKILTFDTDVTERKRVEQHLLRSQRVESIGRLASGVAHDLNNLLTPVLMGASLLRPLVTGEHGQRVIALVEESARRGGELVDRILSFASGADSKRIPVHLRDVVLEVDAIVRSTFTRDITVDIQVPDTLWWVEGDRTQLHQLLLNLCLNACDAMPQGGRLTISADNVTIDEHEAALRGAVRRGRYVRLTVADTGTGVAEDVAEKMFDPFFTTKDVGKGTGLGLATVAAIVRFHRGTIAVQSMPQRGTAFEIRLPAELESEDSHKPRPLPGAGGAGELILVVDDEPPVVTVVKSTLELAGYRVVSAQNGADAVAVFASHAQDIAAVITDLRMPVMDGAALVSTLRRMDATIPIIGSTGSDGQRFRDASADFVLRKPYPADVLLSTVRAAIVRGGEGG